MKALFLGGPRDGLVAMVTVPPPDRLRVPVWVGALDDRGLPVNEVATYALVHHDHDSVTYAVRPGPAQR